MTDNHMDELDKILEEMTHPSRHITKNKHREIAKNQAKRQIEDFYRNKILEELENLSFSVVEPCEPDCDEVRHALHQGSWNAHLKIEERIADITAQSQFNKGGKR